MSSTNKSSRVLVILISLLISIVALAAVYMWQHHKVTDLQSQLQAARSQQTESKSPSPLTQSAAESLVHEFYVSYSKSIGTLGAPADVIAKYGTPNLSFYAKYYNYGFDSIVCTQNPPDTTTISVKAMKPLNNTVPVKVSYGTSDFGPVVTVVERGGLKIDSVSCPGQLGNEPPYPHSITN